MGNYISWQLSVSEATWTETRIERSTSPTTGFAEIASQSITNNTYFDSAGTSSHYYKVRFYDDVNIIFSSYSDVFQANKEYYCTPREVASFVGLPNFDDNSTPTRFEVEDVIIRVCDEIDQYTHKAWRKTTVTNEYYNAPEWTPNVDGLGDWSDRVRIYMIHSKIRQPFTKLECFDGNSWVDWITNYVEARNKDYWIDYDRGIIHFANRYPLRRRQAVRLSYDYGETVVAADIKNAAIMLVAYNIIQRDDRSVLLPEGTTNISPYNKTVFWHKRAYEILDRHIELIIYQ